jgi:hypothetical protein
MKKGPTVYVAVIEHGNGNNVYVAESPKVLEEEIYAFVADWWETEYPDKAMPEDKADAIAEYFEDHHSEYLTRIGETYISVADAPPRLSEQARLGLIEELNEKGEADGCADMTSMIRRALLVETEEEAEALREEYGLN